MDWSEQVCIVAADSLKHRAVKDERTLVELWCRAREGHSVLLLVRGLRPFLEISLPGKSFELPDDIEQRLAVVTSIKEVAKIHDPVTKFTELGDKLHWKVEVGQPYDVPKVRRLLESEWELSSGDILFFQRLLLDCDLGPHISYAGEILWAGARAPAGLLKSLPADRKGEAARAESAARIREAGGRGLYPVDVIAVCDMGALSAVQAFAAPLVTFSFDLETSIEHGTILCAAAVIDRPAAPEAERRSTHTFQGDEREIMAGLTRLVRESDPDIITGYNIDNFDLPKIDSRAKSKCNSSEPLDIAELAGWGRVPCTEREVQHTRNRGAPLLAFRRQTRKWDLRGRCVMDAWWQARMTLRPKRETLRFVSELLFPDREELRKMDVDASRMDEEWADRPDVVLEYCARDSLLPIEILDAISATARKEALAAVAKVPLNTAISGTTSQWLDSLAIRLADRENVAVPMTRRGPRSDAITGGYVHEVEAGTHPWVAVLDFKSMYPSIMIANNICYTTRIEDARGDTPEDANLIHESPSGARFVDKQVKEGLVPRLLVSLMEQRDIHKQGMKEAKLADDAALTHFHDQMQYAVKILMNSFYGVFASSFYRFTHPDLGSAITAWARANIKAIIRSLEEEGHRVVYSDTDSIFVSVQVSEGSPTKDPRSDDSTSASAEDCKKWDAAVTRLGEFGESLAERFSVEGAELEFEKGLAVFFSHGAKKRYVGRVVLPEPELLIRGYEVRRTDSFDLLTKTMMGVFELILDGESDKATKYVVDLIRKIKAGDAEVADLVISRSCKGKVLRDGSVDFEAVYSNPNGLPYVRAARKRIERGLAFTPGMKVSYIVTDASCSPMEVEPYLTPETGEQAPPPDWSFYVSRIARAMGRITEAFGWNENDLIQGNRQSNLFLDW
jgi:DNA polymerase I